MPNFPLSPPQRRGAPLLCGMKRGTDPRPLAVGPGHPVSGNGRTAACEKLPIRRVRVTEAGALRHRSGISMVLAERHQAQE